MFHIILIHRAYFTYKTRPFHFKTSPIDTPSHAHRYTKPRPHTWQTCPTVYTDTHISLLNHTHRSATPRSSACEATPTRPESYDHPTTMPTVLDKYAPNHAHRTYMPSQCAMGVVYMGVNYIPNYSQQHRQTTPSPHKPPDGVHNYLPSLAQRTPMHTRPAPKPHLSPYLARLSPATPLLNHTHTDSPGYPDLRWGCMSGCSACRRVATATCVNPRSFHCWRLILGI